MTKGISIFPRPFFPSAQSINSAPQMKVAEASPQDFDGALRNTTVGRAAACKSGSGVCDGKERSESCRTLTVIGVCEQNSTTCVCTCK